MLFGWAWMAVAHADMPVEIIVVDEHGLEVPEATVSIQRVDARRPVQVAMTGDLGIVERVIEPGVYQLCASHPSLREVCSTQRPRPGSRVELEMEDESVIVCDQSRADSAVRDREERRRFAVHSPFVRMSEDVWGALLPEDLTVPIHFTWIVDVSGSMAVPEKLGVVRSVARQLLKRLRSEDSIALVLYDESAGVVRRRSAAKSRRVRRALRRGPFGRESRGGENRTVTDLLAAEDFDAGHEHRLLLFSDGQPPRKGWRQVSSILREYVDRGMTVTTIGVGPHHDHDDALERFAEDGGGSYVPMGLADPKG